MPKVHVVKNDGSEYVCEECGLSYDECDCDDDELYYGKYKTKAASVKKSVKSEWGNKDEY